MKIQYIHKFGIDNFLDNKTSQVRSKYVLLPLTLSLLGGRRKETLKTTIEVATFNFPAGGSAPYNPRATVSSSPPRLS